MSTCPALDCKATTPADKFMCFHHWRALPNALQTRIYKHYRIGLRNGNVLSTFYCRAAIECIEEIARREGKTFTGQEHKFKIYRRVLDRAPQPTPGTPREPRKDIDG